MQLFSLVNTLLSVDTDSFKRRLHIQTFPVIPLAPNAGLLGWVQDSDTLHVLIRDFRDSRKVLLNIEYRLMLQVRFSNFYYNGSLALRWHLITKSFVFCKK